MKILNTKETMCTSIKIMIQKDDNRYEILDQYKKKGYNITKRPNMYNDGLEDAIKYSPEGVIYTLVKYEPSQIGVDKIMGLLTK